jgi:hypothetical protein
MCNPMLFPHLVRPFLLMGALRSGMLPSVAVYVRRACVFLPCFIPDLETEFFSIEGGFLKKELATQHLLTGSTIEFKCICLL